MGSETNRLRRTRPWHVVGLLAWALTCLGSPSTSAQVDSQIRTLTGARTRLVWSQDQTPDGPHNDPLGLDDNHRLVGLDTDDGRGQRTILANISGYTKPLLTDDGSRVVFSNRVTNKVYVVNWDGSGLREVTSGYASDVWRDPGSGVDWVYVRIGDGGEKNAIWRYDLDHPTTSERIWDKTLVGYEDQIWFQLSGDGKRAAGAFPWNGVGVATLPNVSWKKYGEGCWPSISPDSSYRFFNFTGAHDSIDMFDDPGTNKRTIYLNDAPGLGGHDVYHPRWSNHPRFMTMVGPMTTDDDWGGSVVELYLGQFNDTYTGIAKWIRVTQDSKADYWGDAWIAAGEPKLSVKPTTIALETMMGVTPKAVEVEVANAGSGLLAPVSTSIQPSAASSWLTVKTSGTGDDQLLRNDFDTQALAPGVHEATVTVSSPGAKDSPRTYSVKLTIRKELKLNCGDNGHPVAGWARDDAFVQGGSDFVFERAIDTSSTADAAPFQVYRSCRAKAHSYDFPFVPDGNYRVRLHFADGYEPDGRAMDFTVEGTKRIDGLSILSQVGLFEALVQTLHVTVSDGNGLQIEAAPDSGNDVFVSGIEILPSADDVAPTIQTTTPADGATVRDTITVSGMAADDFRLAAVDVRVDDGAYQAARGLQSWTLELDTSGLSLGEHTLTARATDVFGNTATHASRIRVDNRTLGDPSISILSPTGGEVWPVGSTQNIRWTTENLDAVAIYYSTDKGETWEEIVFSLDDVDERWGNYPWTVPAEASKACLILIKGYFEESPTQSSVFEIRGADGPRRDIDLALHGRSLGCQLHPAQGTPWPILLLIALLFTSRVRRTKIAASRSTTAHTP